MWKAPADHQDLQLSSTEIPGSHGLSEGLNCANCYIHRAFPHPHISALFRGPGNSSAHRTAALCVFLLTFVVHVPTIAVKASFSPLETYSRGDFCEVPKHYLSSTAALPLLHAWIVRCVLHQQCQGNEYLACQHMKVLQAAAYTYTRSLPCQKFSAEKGFWLIIILSPAWSHWPQTGLCAV